MLNKEQKAERLALIRERHRLLRAKVADLEAELDADADPEPEIAVKIERDDEALTPVYVSPPDGAEEHRPEAMVVHGD